MLYLSGQPSKEVRYEDSIYREQRFPIFLSVIVAFGHESHLRGPLFFDPDGDGAAVGSLFPC
jgi:hypothetical protein